MIPANLIRSWSRAWRGIGAGDDDDGVRDTLLRAYAEPERSYHTLQHLHECVDRFGACIDLAEHAAEVETALWFHDAVYDVHRSDNERRSADRARQAAIAAGAPADTAARIDALVMATCHRTVPVGADAELVVDIDLAILGADPARFAEYERQIRSEYAHVAETVFKAKRRAILAGFLARARIYATPRLHAELEAAARTNLSRAVAGSGV